MKHWAGFLAAAVEGVLASTGASLAGVDYVAVCRDPPAHLLFFPVFQKPPLGGGNK